MKHKSNIGNIVFFLALFVLVAVGVLYYFDVEVGRHIKKAVGGLVKLIVG